MTSKRDYRTALKYGVAVATLGSVLASAPTAFSQDQATDQEVDLEAEEIVITGSRIRRDGFTAPSPVTVLSDEAISLQGEINVANVLNQLPALGSTFTNASSTGFIGTTGLSFLDLRRLGTDRTLVLVDGRRHVGSEAGSASVDINSIPQELIERIEVVTGGASAVYGADAVSGVVNFIMKKDFEGVSLYGQAGQADEGDAFSYVTRGIIGGNFGGGRGNAVLTFEWAESDGFLANDRSFRRRSRTFVQNPDDTDTPTNPTDGIPDEILIENATLNFITLDGLFLDLTGAIDTTGEGFLIEGDSFRSFQPGSPRFFADGVEVGGDGLLLSDIGGSANADLQRLITTARVSYELHPAVNMFVEAKYVNAQSFSFNGTGAFDIFSLGITADNAFLPSSVQNALTDAGIPLDDSTVFLVSRSHNEAERFSEPERQLFRGVIGFEGDLGDDINYELSYVYGRATNQVRQGNNRINDRFFAGVDAVRISQTDLDNIVDTDLINPAVTSAGDIVCRSTLEEALGNDNSAGLPEFAFSGCVPIDIIGSANEISDEAIDFAYAQGFLNETLEQNVITLAFTGTSEAIGFELPAGAIGWAVGTEYREEKAESVPTAVDQLGLSFLNLIPPTRGSFDVWEAFGELSIPILTGVPFAEELIVDGAVRFADYSTVGSATSWKVGAEWAPTSDLRFRGTYSRAIRAPNISELFGPQSQTFLFFDDPCDPAFIDQGSPTREANCDALGRPAGFQQDNTRGNTPGTTGGNPNLNEETADTFTVGLVYQPEFIPGLGLSVDFWDIEIEDAISVAALNDVLANCVDADSINNQFCSLITRDPVTFQVETFRITNQNFAALEARGLDFELNYVFDLDDVGLDGWGTIDLRSIATRVLKRDEFPFQIQPDFVDDEKGELGDPEWVVNNNVTWNWDRLTFNYELRYISSMVVVEIDDLRTDPDLQFPVDTGDTFYHDIQGRFRLTDNLEIFGGINNLTQKFPPLNLSGAGTDSAIFDNIGRFYYGGVRATF